MNKELQPILQLISDDRIDEAIDTLTQWADQHGSPRGLHNSLLQITNRYNRFQARKLARITSEEDQSVQYNRIVYDLSQLLNQCQANSFTRRVQRNPINLKILGSVSLLVLVGGFFLAWGTGWINFGGSDSANHSKLPVLQNTEGNQSPTNYIEDGNVVVNYGNMGPLKDDSTIEK